MRQILDARFVRSHDVGAELGEWLLMAQSCRVTKRALTAAFDPGCVKTLENCSNSDFNDFRQNLASMKSRA